MPLNEFGKLAVAELVFYVPILGFALFVALRNGFGRGQGWFYIFAFSNVRLIGAGVTLVSQLQNNPSTGLFIAAAILQGVGLSPLLMATLGFISTISRYGLKLNYTLTTRLLHLLLTGGLILGIVGGTKATPDNDADTISQGRTFSKVANILFFIAYTGLVGVHTLLWGESSHIPFNHRKLLTSVSISLPFLFVRVIYSLLNAFSSSSQNKWSPINGTWWIFLIMGLAMEYIVVSVYVATGVLAHLKSDETPHARGIPVSVAQNGSDEALAEMGIRKLREHRERRRR